MSNKDSNKIKRAFGEPTETKVQSFISNLSVRPWTTIQREKIADCRVFSVHKQISMRTAGDSSETHNFFVFRPHDWVNIIPVTADYQVVMIEQYRHGIEQITLEIPGGMIDAEDVSSATAGERELLEETGFTGDRAIFLGRNHPNPAIQSNICDTYLALNVSQIEVPQFGGTEEVAIRLVPIKEIPSLIADGHITHALVIVAFHYLQQYCRKNRNTVPDALNPFS